MFRNGPFRSTVPPEVEERRHREKFSDYENHDEFLDRRDRHLPEDLHGTYSERHIDRPLAWDDHMGKAA